MKKRTVIRGICTVVLVCISLYFLQEILMPKYVSDVVEGDLIAEYYEEEKDHDVLFIGDCEVYENFSPVVLWEEYGINSYIRGSAQQLIWQSYYLLEDTLRYETPDVVVFNVLSMKYNEPQKEAYNRMSIEGMEWSMSKVNCIKASMTEEEQFLDYVFPILRYHGRWQEVTTEDFTEIYETDKVSHNGYYMRVDVKPAGDVPEGKILADYNFGENAYFYLDKMRTLCEEKGIELILVKAPSLYPYWYEEWEMQIEEYANMHNLCYINYLELLEETGIDFQTDTYDGGLHLNLSGAEKLSRHFGNVLVEEGNLEDRRGEAELAERWEEKIEAYHREEETQYKKLAEGESL